MKKKTYVFFIVVIALLLVLVSVLRFTTKKNPSEIFPPQTVIPTHEVQSASSEKLQNEKTTDIQIEGVPVPLLQDELFINSSSIDINNDGMEDLVFSVKKLSDPVAYLIIALQNPVLQQLRRVAEIRTGVSRSPTMLFYTINSPLNELPTIVCTGMTNDDKQVLSMYSPEIDKKGNFSILTIADFRSDGEINLKEAHKSNSLGNLLYDIYVTSSDSQAQNPLDQIERVYSWNEKRKAYVQIKESRIPGKKIASQLMYELQRGDKTLFKQFLSGSWQKPSEQGSIPQFLYYDELADELIFLVDNIQEIFIVTASASRRYGLYLTTKNKSIPNIIRRVDIQLVDVDKIKVRVIEDVARLKIMSVSTWNGIYQKQLQTNKRNLQNSGHIKKNAEQFLDTYSAQWKTGGNTEQISLILTKNRYYMSQGETVEKGFYGVIEVDKKIVLECKPENDTAKFFLMGMHIDEKTNVAHLNLQRVSISLDASMSTLGKVLSFEQPISASSLQ